MKKIISILISLLIFQSQAFSQPLGFSLFINVGNKTTLTGAVIGSETGEMTFSTKELEYNDLKDINTNKSTGFGLSTSVGFGKGESNATTDTQKSSLSPKGTTTLSFKNTGNEQEQTTKATIGEGTINVSGNVINDGVVIAGSDPQSIEGLNRDMTNSQEVTKDQITGALDASVTIDNRLLTSEGRKDIANQFANVGENLNKIYENITENNIVVQSVKTALDGENDLNLLEAAKEYTNLDKKSKQVLNDKQLSQEINGATNLTPEQLKESLTNIAAIYNENGEIFKNLEISNVEGNVAGLSYVDASGQKQTITINLAGVDITDVKAMTEVIAHETTNITSHQAKEGNATARGSMASAIMDMNNYAYYGNMKLNKVTTEECQCAVSCEVRHAASSVLSLRYH